MRRRHVSSLVALVALVLATMPPPARGQVSIPEVELYDSLAVLRPGDPLPAASFPGLMAARNEFESFQVSVTATGDTTDVAVGLDGAFRNATGSIPSAEVTVYRVGDYDVPNDYLSDLDSLEVGGDGRYPDALIPEVDPFTGEARSAFPIDLALGERVTAWIDVHIPQDQASGDYATNVEVTVSGEVVATETVSLRVHDFTIPSKSTLDNAYFIQDMTSLCMAHYNTANCGSKEKKWELAGLYGRAALENRVTIANISPLGQNGGPPSGDDLTYFTQEVLPLIDGSAPELRLDGARMTTQAIYTYAGHHCIGACIDAWEDFAQSHGYAGRLLLYACDEAGTSQAAWDACSQNGLSHDASSPKLATAAVQDAEAAGYLDLIDILVVNVRNMAAKPGYRFEGNQRPAYDDYVANNAAGPANSLWLYHACDSMSCTQIPNSQDEYWDHPLYDGWPSHGIDQPATFARAMGWLAYAYDASGELYWEVAQRLKTAWTNQFEHGAQGDGNLFYAGRPSAADWDPAAPGIGGATHGPIESIRLKRIRDGREDYEYLHHLAVTQGQSATADAIVSDLVGSLDSATYEQIGSGELVTHRCQLALTITGAEQCFSAPFDPGPDPDPETTQHPRGITLRLRHRDGKLIAKGGIYVDDGFFTCSQNQTVEISRNGTVIATKVTNFDYSAYKARLPHRAGRYKASVAEFDNGTDYCPAAMAKVRHNH